MDLFLHPAAMAEAREARRWYEARSQALSEAFLAELVSALESISTSPERWPLRAGLRRRVMRRFPFLIVYRVVGGRVEVVAVAHARRRPGYWERR